jgi:7-carboxy-7-deazaguanine synthase
MGDVMDTLAVAEMFGPTFQGEGPSLGKRCVFLRLSGCNLMCVWCDTPYTWDWEGRNGKVYNVREESKLLTVAQIFGSMNRLDSNAMWVISGGEPMLQYKGIAELLRNYGGEVEIETNGTIDPRPLVETVQEHRGEYVDIIFNVSPKLLHAGNGPTEERWLRVYDAYESRFKFVCQNVQDLDEVAGIVKRNHIQKDAVWIMPEGKEAGPINRTAHELADEVLKRGWNLTTRLHVQLWGDKRGR